MRLIRCMRSVSVIVAVLIGLTNTAAIAAPACTGTDLLDKMKSEARRDYDEILAAAGREVNANAILWKIERKGVEPSWLFGTIHLSDDRVTTLSAAVGDALRAAKTLALEVDDLGPEAMQAAMAEVGSLVLSPSGSRLDQALSADEFAQVTEHTSGMGLPAEAAAVMRPWFIAMVMALPECERARQAAGVKALDLALAEQAKSSGISVVGLETIKEQLTSLGSMPDSTGLAWLRSSLKLAPQLDDVTQTVVGLYLHRQMGASWLVSQKLSKEAAIPAPQLAQFQKALVDERNERMRTRAKPLLAQGGTMIAVGALHLSGPTGLVALLRRDGFTLTAIE